MFLPEDNMFLPIIAQNLILFVSCCNSPCEHTMSPNLRHCLTPLHDFPNGPPVWKKASIYSAKMALQKEDFQKVPSTDFQLQFSPKRADFGGFFSLMGVVWIPMVNLFENWKLTSFWTKDSQKRCPTRPAFWGERPDIIPLFVLLKWKTCTVSRDQNFGQKTSKSFLPKVHRLCELQMAFQYWKWKWFLWSSVPSMIPVAGGSHTIIMSFQQRQASMMSLILIFPWRICIDDGVFAVQTYAISVMYHQQFKIYLYILHSFTSQNNLKVKPHFVFRCFTQKTQWDFIFAPGTNLLRKFQKFQVPWSPKPRNPNSRHVLGDSTREVLVFRTSSWYPEIEQCLYLIFLVCIEIGAM